MTIKELQRKQQELDDYIIKMKKLEDMDQTHLLSNMFLAAIDELCNEVKEDIENPEEWIDFLHFCLSISNRLDLEPEVYEFYVELGLNQCYDTAEEYILRCMRVSKCFKHWSNKKPDEKDLEFMELSLSLCIGAIDQACKALNANMFEEYEKKYKINIQRQRENY